MLTELVVENLGVIERLGLVLSPGMTALTGETGAGKTLIVTAVDLLLGGKASPTLVRHGASEAHVEGRFVRDGEEVILRRTLSAESRSRAYIDGRLASVAALSELGRELVDLHGQHAHQSLLRRAPQRRALDQFGAVDLSLLVEARAGLADLERRRAELGGDERSRAREIELIRYQLGELDAVGVEDPDEDQKLRAMEAVLADATAHRRAARDAAVTLGADGQVGAELARINAELEGRELLADHHERVMSLVAEAADLSTELRRSAEAIDEDPVRLAEVRKRREDLTSICRKYGETLADVMEFQRDLAQRVAELEDFDRLARDLDTEHDRLTAAVVAAGREVGEARRASAGLLAQAVTAHLRDLALARAEVQVTVGDDPGDHVEILLAANSGAPGLALDSAASGGELARVMLALRLVLTAGPPVLVFDEVDAGIGGATAQTVGKALARLAGEHQVLVVTHLAQVAACADNQVSITKRDDGAHPSVTAETLAGEDRVTELSRMLSGSPESETARQHAAELLSGAVELPNG